MTPKEYKKKMGESGTIFNTFDVEKLTEYMKTTSLFKASYKDNFLKSSEVRRTMFMCDKRKRDSDNGQTSILDLLVREGVIVDDNWFIVRRLIADNDFEKGNPHCIITIKDL